jgi:hypothetical protein
MPMADATPRQFADDCGVWHESIPGYRSGIEWGEVYSVSGHKLDAVTEVYTCIVLDFEFGEFVEFYDCRPGFQQVVAAITKRLPGISPGWFERVERLGVKEPPLEVWCRAERSD